MPWIQIDNCNADSVLFLIQHHEVKFNAHRPDGHMDKIHTPCGGLGREFLDQYEEFSNVCFLGELRKEGVRVL